MSVESPLRPVPAHRDDMQTRLDQLQGAARTNTSSRSSLSSAGGVTRPPSPGVLATIGRGIYNSVVFVATAVGFVIGAVVLGVAKTLKWVFTGCGLYNSSPSRPVRRGLGDESHVPLRNRFRNTDHSSGSSRNSRRTSSGTTATPSASPEFPSALQNLNVLPPLVSNQRERLLAPYAKNLLKFHLLRVNNPQNRNWIGTLYEMTRQPNTTLQGVGYKGDKLLAMLAVEDAVHSDRELGDAAQPAGMTTPRFMRDPAIVQRVQALRTEYRAMNQQEQLRFRTELFQGVTTTAPYANVQEARSIADAIIPCFEPFREAIDAVFPDFHASIGDILRDARSQVVVSPERRAELREINQRAIDAIRGNTPLVVDRANISKAPVITDWSSLVQDVENPPAQIAQLQSTNINEIAIIFDGFFATRQDRESITIRQDYSTHGATKAEWRQRLEQLIAFANTAAATPAEEQERLGLVELLKQIIIDLKSYPGVAERQVRDLPKAQAVIQELMKNTLLLCASAEGMSLDEATLSLASIYETLKKWPLLSYFEEVYANREEEENITADQGSRLTKSECRTKIENYLKWDSSDLECKPASIVLRLIQAEMRNNPNMPTTDKETALCGIAEAWGHCPPRRFAETFKQYNFLKGRGEDETPENFVLMANLEIKERCLEAFYMNASRFSGSGIREPAMLLNYIRRAAGSSLGLLVNETALRDQYISMGTVSENRHIDMPWLTGGTSYTHDADDFERIIEEEYSSNPERVISSLLEKINRRNDPTLCGYITQQIDSLELDDAEAAAFTDRFIKPLFEPIPNTTPQQYRIHDSSRLALIPIPNTDPVEYYPGQFTMINKPMIEQVPNSNPPRYKVLRGATISASNALARVPNTDPAEYTILDATKVVAMPRTNPPKFRVIDECRVTQVPLSSPPIYTINAGYAPIQEQRLSLDGVKFLALHFGLQKAQAAPPAPLQPVIGRTFAAIPVDRAIERERWVGSQNYLYALMDKHHTRLNAQSQTLLDQRVATPDAPCKELVARLVAEDLITDASTVPTTPSFLRSHDTRITALRELYRSINEQKGRLLAFVELVQTNRAELEELRTLENQDLARLGFWERQGLTTRRGVLRGVFGFENSSYETSEDRVRRQRRLDALCAEAARPPIDLAQLRAVDGKALFRTCLHNETLPTDPAEKRVWDDICKRIYSEARQLSKTLSKNDDFSRSLTQAVDLYQRS